MMGQSMAWAYRDPCAEDDKEIILASYMKRKPVANIAFVLLEF
jgi:hypothetical protein